jgi:hypothetical protein
MCWGFALRVWLVQRDERTQGQHLRWVHELLVVLLEPLATTFIEVLSVKAAIEWICISVGAVNTAFDHRLFRLHWGRGSHGHDENEGKDGKDMLMHCCESGVGMRSQAQWAWQLQGAGVVGLLFIAPGEAADLDNRARERP